MLHNRAVDAKTWLHVGVRAALCNAVAMARVAASEPPARSAADAAAGTARGLDTGHPHQPNVPPGPRRACPSSSSSPPPPSAQGRGAASATPCRARACSSPAAARGTEHRFYAAPGLAGRGCKEDHPRGHARLVRLARQLARRDDRRSAAEQARAPQSADVVRLGCGQRRDGSRDRGAPCGARHAPRQGGALRPRIRRRQRAPCVRLSRIARAGAQRFRRLEADQAAPAACYAGLGCGPPLRQP